MNEPTEPTASTQAAPAAQATASKRAAKKASSKKRSPKGEPPSEARPAPLRRPIVVDPPGGARRARSYWKSEVVALMRLAADRDGASYERIARAFEVRTGAITETIEPRTVRGWFGDGHSNQIPVDRFLRLLIEGPGLSEEAHRSMLRAIAEAAGYELTEAAHVDLDRDGLGTQITEITAALGETARATIEATGPLSAEGRDVSGEELATMLARASALRREATELERALLARADGGGS